MEQTIKYGIITGAGALVLKPLLNGISKVLTLIPGVEVSLQSISIQTTGLTDVINPGLNQYVQQLFGYLTTAFTIPQFIMLFVGGFLFGVIGHLLYNLLKLESTFNIKSKYAKVTSIFVIASLITTAIISMNIALPALAVLIPLIISSFLIAALFIWLDDLFKTKMIG
jgi:hypothetical protein